MFHSGTGSKPVVREILTLQVGHYANCVGTHWWNIQDSSFCYDPKEAARRPKEIESDFLFREGKTLLDEVTYTPRCLVFDLKDSLRTLRPLGNLYASAQSEPPVSWPGDVTLHQTAPHSKNEFLRDLEREEFLHSTGGEAPPARTSVGSDAKSDADEMSLSRGSSNVSPPSGDASFSHKKLYDLDEEVEVWSDFLRPHLHPKTVSILPQYTHADKNDSLDVFSLGTSIFGAHQDYEDDVEDRLRFFVEDCDSLQGFQLLVDAFDGISGFGAALLERLADEHASKCTIAFPVSPGVFRDSAEDALLLRTYRAANVVSSFQALATHCNLVVPLNCGSSFYAGSRLKDFPHLNLKPIYYHSAAVLAAALDSFTAPYRRYDNPLSMSELPDAVGISGRRFADASVALPLLFARSEGGLVGSLLEPGSDTPPWRGVSSFVDARSLSGGASRRRKLGSAHRVSSGAVAAQSVTVAGVPTDAVKCPASSSRPDSSRAVTRCVTAEDVLSLYLSRTYPSCASSLTLLRNATTTAAPFPHIFNHTVGSDGILLDDGEKRSSHIAVDAAPVASALQSRDETGRSLLQLARVGGGIDLQRFHKIAQASMEAEEFGESIVGLRQAASCYGVEEEDSEGED